MTDYARGLHDALKIVVENRIAAEKERERMEADGEEEQAEQCEAAVTMADYIETEIRALPGFVEMQVNAAGGGA